MSWPFADLNALAPFEAPAPFEDLHSQLEQWTNLAFDSPPFAPVQLEHPGGLLYEPLVFDLPPPAPAAAVAEDDAANAAAVEEDKRKRNTAASARFRIKKKQREAALETSSKQLRDQVSTLEAEVKALRTENGMLRGLITDKTALTLSSAALSMDGAEVNDIKDDLDTPPVAKRARTAR